MARSLFPAILFPMLLASIVLAAPTSAQDAAKKSYPDPLRPDLFKPPIDPTGEFVYLDAYVDLQRARDTFPPEGIAAEFIGLGGTPCHPIYRRRVPAGRVPEVQALLWPLRPPPGAKF